MDLRQLRYFLAVAEELHFGRAAVRLHMSQPPLSVHVGRLERELGTPLFERSTRRVRLTPAGEHLRLRAEGLLAEVEAVRAELRDFADGLSGALTAGFVSSASYTVLPAVVSAFRDRRPNVDLRLSPLTSGEQLDRLRAGTLDVGIVRDEAPHDPDLSVEVVFEERLVACLPVGHALADRGEVTAEEIVQLPLISYPVSLMPGYVARVAEVLRVADGAAQVVEEVVHQETALGFVAAGVGTSILPESVRHLVPVSIVTVPLAGSPTSRLLAVYRSAERARAATFVACLHEAATAWALPARRFAS